MGKIYLIPNLLGETAVERVVPAYVLNIIRSLKTFATENERNTRRYLKLVDKDIVIDDILFLELSEHSTRVQVEACLKMAKTTDVGIISEAGCPGIADPGADLVALAHEHRIPVVPLVGPSSILMALIASGCSGQHFSFNGYLPIKPPERTRAIRGYERESAQEDRTQIFIETPYRNLKLYDELLASLQPTTRLCIACDISTDNEYIITRRVADWKKTPPPDIQKRPTIFIIYAK